MKEKEFDSTEGNSMEKSGARDRLKEAEKSNVPHPHEKEKNECNLKIAAGDESSQLLAHW